MIHWRRLLICLPALLAATSLPLLAVAAIGGAGNPLVLCLDPQGGFSFHLGLDDHHCADTSHQHRHEHSHGDVTHTHSHCCCGHHHDEPDEPKTEAPVPQPTDFTDVPLSVDVANDDPQIGTAARIVPPAACGLFAPSPTSTIGDELRASFPRGRAPPHWPTDNLPHIHTIALLL